ESVATAAYAEGRRRGLAAGDLEKALTDNGYEPQSDGDGLALCNCPFRRLAVDHTQLVCGLSAALLQGTLDGCNDQQHRVTPAPEGSACCARLTTSAE
ncbi:MAG: transcriptional regulator, partial [Actinomycetes bacterium]